MARFLIFAGLLVLGATHAVGGEIRSALTGRWTVTGTADAQETTSLSSDEVDKLTGTELVVTAESVRFSNETCDKPIFMLTRHSTASFFRREYKIDPIHLRLPHLVTEIEIVCQAPSPISFVYFKDKRHVVFFWKGFFLNAEKRIEGKP
ncbi:hypothetical protein [Burkholderia sp. LMU1-1-1.1]|uniref:hypothetical protein n=1 Tax=Burkholderia sp. LMU1-1-1.1 TaxID=3135266 RepID=UPI003443BA50